MLTVLPTLLVQANLFTLAAMPAAATQDAPTDHVLRINWGVGVPAIDPQFSHEGQWSISGGLVYEGLTRLDEDLQVAPGAAESWVFSPDGKTLTFHLREGLRFGDAAPVVATDFVYAAERLCSPELDSASATGLFDVIGCEEFFTATGDSAAADAARDAFGVRARDDRTLEYQFERPAPYFLARASLWTAMPLRQDLVEARGPRWWANPATRVGNGPFRLVEYTTEKPDARVRYARTEHYWGGRTKLDELDFRFLDFDPAMAAYRHNEIDVIWPGEMSIPALEAVPVLIRELVARNVLFGVQRA